MAFFRSPLVRRIIYVIAFGLALVRFSQHAHSETLASEAGATAPVLVEIQR